jgi:ABC-2 type transport system permease protein
MGGTWAVMRRELFSLWVTPLAWVLLSAFLLVNGAAFSATMASLASYAGSGLDLGPVQAFYGQSVFIPLGYALFCPLLSMRSLAEERRSGTADLLLSSPLSTLDIVLGKYLALAATYVALWAPTLLYPFILRDTGHIEWCVVATTYTGVVGVGLGCVALGLFASAITSNQLLAATLAGTLTFALVLCGVGAQLVAEGPLHEVLVHLSIQATLTECAQGILSLRRIVYIGTLIVMAQYFTLRAVERWRRP